MSFVSGRASRGPVGFSPPCELVMAAPNVLGTSQEYVEDKWHICESLRRRQCAYSSPEMGASQRKPLIVMGLNCERRRFSQTCCDPHRFDGLHDLAGVRTTPVTRLQRQLPDRFFGQPEVNYGPVDCRHRIYAVKPASAKRA